MRISCSSLLLPLCVSRNLRRRKKGKNLLFNLPFLVLMFLTSLLPLVFQSVHGCVVVLADPHRGVLSLFVLRKIRRPVRYFVRRRENGMGFVGSPWRCLEVFRKSFILYSGLLVFGVTYFFVCVAVEHCPSLFGTCCVLDSLASIFVRRLLLHPLTRAFQKRQRRWAFQFCVPIHA